MVAKLTGVERTFDDSEFIVSKTDLRGVITYCNSVFRNLAGYSEEELLGKPHNLIRHPDMPRSVFWLLWDRIQGGEEIFAYVLNLAKNGDHYWVFAHVTPTFDEAGGISGYHSNRRKPDKAGVLAMKGVYAALREEESRHSNKRDAVQAGVALLTKILDENGSTYDEFVWSLARAGLLRRRAV